MNRKIVFAPGEFYHLYNRGTDRREIFLDAADYARFIALLYLCNNTDAINMRELLGSGRTYKELFEYDRGDQLVDIGAYCLMPNHFHLLVREKKDKGISLFMQKVITAYAMYFNTKHKRTGTLFQGRFQAQHADTDEYLKYLYAYIHLNPVKLINENWKKRSFQKSPHTLSFLHEYAHSSYLDYLEPNVPRPANAVLEKKEFPDYFPNKKDFLSTIEEWLNFDKGQTFAKV